MQRMTDLDTCEVEQPTRAGLKATRVPSARDTSNALTLAAATVTFQDQSLVGACLATGDRIFATGSDSVSKNALRSCGCFCLISVHTIMD